MQNKIAGKDTPGVCGVREPEEADPGVGKSGEPLCSGRHLQLEPLGVLDL